MNCFFIGRFVGFGFLPVLTIGRGFGFVLGLVAFNFAGLGRTRGFASGTGTVLSLAN